MKSKIFLSTTALSKFWDKNAEKILFLGEWCKLYKVRGKYKKLNYDTLDYIWNDEQEIDNGIKYVEDIYQKLLVNLIAILNDYHNVDKNLKYWDTLLKPWLFSYIQVLYDRYRHIKFAKDNYSNLYTYTIDEKEYQIINTPSTFGENIILSDEYNLQLYSQIIKFLNIEYTDLNYKMKKLNIEIRVKSSIKENILVCVSKLLNKIFNKKSVLVVSPYFKTGILRKIIELSIKSKFLFVFDSFKYNIFVSKNPDLRLRKSVFKNLQFKDEFEDLIFQTFVYSFPIIYLEGYHDFNNKTMALPIKKSKVIYSANAIHGNEIFKFYVANSSQDLIRTYAQHGGNIGMDKINIPEVIERNFADVYFTFGWKELNTKVLPLSILSTGLTKNIQSDKIYFIMTTMPRYFLRFVYQEDSSKMLDYIKNTKQFLLNFKHIDNLVIRSYMQDYNWSVKERLLEVNQNLKFDNKTNYYEQIENGKLVIFDNMHTGYLESLSMNTPTVIIITKNIYYFRNAAKPFIQKLFDVKILFDDPIKASKFVDKIYDNIDEWWLSEEVQKVREEFCYNYARTSENWSSEWVKEFTKILEEQ